MTTLVCLYSTTYDSYTSKIEVEGATADNPNIEHLFSMIPIGGFKHCYIITDTFKPILITTKQYSELIELIKEYTDTGSKVELKLCDMVQVVRK